MQQRGLAAARAGAGGAFQQQPLTALFPNAGSGQLFTGATLPIPDSISDAALRTQLGNPADFVRSNYAIAAPYANSFYEPRRYQIMARVQF